ncbi:hypothetical protein [Aminicella lysinilytica]|uniref:WD40 repeat protein n=1 Tax=Aminicella lysinilytica TaxID=433323 RepID=A0A4R6PXE0_9FIRM|nr:hypothetical protein [Aminicella lysinilytica]TDP50805.1 hypothetical protein EV211_1365 [Aminicella lysinilytica]
MSRNYKISIFLLSLILSVVVLLLVFPAVIQVSNSVVYGADDQREAAHGMNFVTNPVTGESYIFWSDQYDSGSDSDGDWTHDIYYQQISLDDPQITDKHVLISAPEAQEPASVSCTSDGEFFVTFEDGNTKGYGGLSQRYATFDKDMSPVKAYPQTVALGGHSGHGACTSNKMITFWSNEWVDGGGVDNLGTGKDVCVTSMNYDGSKARTLKLTKGKTREWWPIVTASKSNVLLVWQRYIKNHTYSNVCYAVYDPSTGKLNYRGIQALKNIKAKYYTYNAVYLRNLNRYVINITTSNNKSIVLLLNSSGKIVYKKTGLPAFAREASPAVLTKTGADTLCYAKSPSGATFLRVTKNGIRYVGSAKSTYKWGYRGTSGFYTKDGKVACFASLSKDRVVLKKFKSGVD